ncbi:hypothetical protein HN873_008737, partial [Arachis hypogaea]
MKPDPTRSPVALHFRLVFSTSSPPSSPGSQLSSSPSSSSSQHQYPSHRLHCFLVLNT